MGMTDMTNHVVGKMIGEARAEGEYKDIKATNKCDVAWLTAYHNNSQARSTVE